MLPLTDDDYSLLAALQHERLRSLYPELLAAAFITRADATLTLICDWLTLQAIGKDLETFSHFAYVLTGCNAVTFFVNGDAVLTQVRDASLVVSVNEAKEMTAIAELETAAIPAYTTAEIDFNTALQVIADEIARRALARVNASAPIVNAGYRQQAAQDAALTPEQPPVIEAATPPAPPTIEAPAKLPGVRLQGIYTPTASNFTQSAKRYLKAVDGVDGARALKEIIAGTIKGRAHLKRAARDYPEPEKAEGRLYKGFLKVAEERGLAIEVAAQ